MSALEIIANAITAISIVLAGRGSVQTWWTGILGGALFAVLFYETQLYADVTLQLFFVATSVLGWIRWVGGRSGVALPVTRGDPVHLLACAVGGLAVAAAYGAMLHRFTNAYSPFWDSAVLVASVIAQLLLVRRKLECWLFWLLVNSIAVPLYASRGLYLTSGLYAAYWLNAVVSWFAWRRQIGPGMAAPAGAPA